MQSVAREAAVASTAIPELVGSSAAIAEVRRAVSRAAAAPFAVLIEGESGVGKELVARAIHCLSPRRERRFCDLNCAALPDELLESELFGHARGAFTGAIAERGGLVEEADGGTLFLDEVADLSPRAQAKLLRVLQQQEVRRVGESFSRKVDVRIVSAVNRDMRVEAAAGRFRQDLLYRLDVIRIRVPPLRERPEDIPPLAHHFWTIVAARVGTRAALAHTTITALSRYSWPGNVRELQNVMSALAVAAPARGQVRASLLPQAISGTAAAGATTLADARAHFERRFIEMALARADGKRARAARELGLSRQGLLKMITRLGIPDPR
jgi:transcriptional regulator with PAS, ATPase and Fis domain